MNPAEFSDFTKTVKSNASAHLISNVKQLDQAFERVACAIQEFHSAAHDLQYLAANTTLNLNFGSGCEKKAAPEQTLQEQQKSETSALERAQDFLRTSLLDELIALGREAENAILCDTTIKCECGRVKHRSDAKYCANCGRKLTAKTGKGYDEQNTESGEQSVQQPTAKNRYAPVYITAGQGDTENFAPEDDKQKYFGRDANRREQQVTTSQIPEGWRDVKKILFEQFAFLAEGSKRCDAKGVYQLTAVMIELAKLLC